MPARPFLPALLLFAVALPFDPAVSWAEANHSRRIHYSGKLGADLAVLVDLRFGPKLEGSYQYVRFGKEIPLAGSVQADGSFSLEEAGGTGALEGRFTEDFRTAKGEWISPDGKRRLPFELERFAEEVRASGSKKGCTVSSAHPRLFLDDRAVSDAANKAVASRRGPTVEEFCADYEATGSVEWTSETTYSVVAFEPRYVSIAFGVWEYSGGAHGNSGTSALTVSLDRGQVGVVKLGDFLEPEGIRAVTEACFSRRSPLP